MIQNIVRSYEKFDGILHGDKWADQTLTFSFPSSASVYDGDYDDITLNPQNNNFEALNAEIGRASCRERVYTKV